MDAFTIKKLAGHHSISVSEAYVHPTPGPLERGFERFEAHAVPTKVPTVKSVALMMSWRKAPGIEVSTIFAGVVEWQTQRT